jgi:hypothetical protein
MRKKAVVLFLLAACFAGIALADGNPAHFVFWKGFKMNAVSVDGQVLSLSDFMENCKEKSPRAYELLRVCKDRRDSAGGSGFFGFVIAVTGYNKYMDTRGMTDSVGIITRQAEGIGFMLLGAVLMINGHTSDLASQDMQIKAIEYYNMDTGRMKVSLGSQSSPAGVTLSKRF